MYKYCMLSQTCYFGSLLYVNNSSVFCLTSFISTELFSVKESVVVGDPAGGGRVEALAAQARVGECWVLR